MKEKLSKWMMALSGCLMFLLVFGMNVQAAEDNISANNDWIAGSTESDTVDYYELHIPSPGRVTIVYQSYMPYGNCDLYDKDLTKMYQGVRISGSDVAPATKEFSVDLKAGEYRLKLFGAISGTQPTKPSNYRMKVSLEPVENNETEPNDSFATAMPVTNQTLIQGFLSEEDCIDFYKFTIGEKTSIEVTATRGTLERYHFSIWNSDMIRVAYTNNVTAQTKVWKKVLEPGTYYIKINEATRTGSYTLKWEGNHYVSGIQLNAEAIVMKPKASYNLLKAVLPANATNKELQWTSGNPSVAVVDASGRVTAKAAGVTTIKAVATDGSKVQASCDVVVRPAKTKITSCKKLTDRNVCVKIKKQKGARGVQFQMCKKKNFTGKKSSYYTTGTSATTAALSKNTTYYFRARSYVSYGGKRYFGDWSKVKQITTGSKTKRSGYYYPWKL